MNDQAREARMRRRASSAGLILKKIRRRNPDAIDFGRYWLIDPNINGLVCTEWGMDLDEVEAWFSPDQ